MENNYETLRMPELKALTREHKLRGYSRLRGTSHPRTRIGSSTALN